MANKFQMNLDHFKKVKADDNSTTLKHIKDNHEIKIAHKALSEQQKDKLSKLEMHADGGFVGEEDQALQNYEPYEPEKITPKEESKEGYYKIPSSSVQSGSLNTERGKYEPFFSGIEQREDITPPEMQAPQQAVSVPLKGQLLADTGTENAANILAQSPETQPADMQVAQPGGLDQLGQQQMKGLEMQGQGLQAQAQAQGQLGLQQAEAQKQHQARIETEMSNYQQKRAAIEQDSAKMKDEIAQGHLDPDHFINNLSTGGRINTAIGLILGGMGAGLTHGPNLAYNFLQKQIDEDINAQKTEMGKKENLLRHNYQEMGNLDSAYDKTRMQMNDMLLAKLSQQEGTAKNAIAQGQIQNIMGTIMSKQGELADSIAKRQAINEAFSSNDPERALTAMSMVNPEQADKLRGRMVPGMGFANTPGDADKMKAMNADAIPARKIIGRLREINKIWGKSIDPEVRSEAFNLSKTLVGQLNRSFTGGGPMSETEQKMINEIAQNPTAFFTLGSSTEKSLSTLENTLNNKVNALAQVSGLKQQNFNQPQKQQPGQQYEERMINGKKYRVPKGQ